MDNVYVGKIVNTHGIKGEIRVLSDFEKKDQVFKVGNEVIIRGISFKIASYRVHKNFDMITLEGYNDINQVLPYKGYSLFVKRELLELNSDDYLLSDLINKYVYLNDEELGIVSDYTTGGNPLLIVDYNGKNYYIPLKGDFITNVDIKGNKIYVDESVKGLM